MASLSTSSRARKNGKGKFRERPQCNVRMPPELRQAIEDAKKREWSELSTNDVLVILLKKGLETLKHPQGAARA